MDPFEETGQTYTSLLLVTRKLSVITYSKGRREAFSIHPSIRPVMASYNNPLQCEG